MLIRLVVALTGFWASTGVILAQTPQQQVLDNTLNHYIVPAYSKLAAATGRLSQAIENLCENPAASQLDNVRTEFIQTVQAWGQIEWFRAGPVLDQNRVERFFYFPDRKSRGLRQVQTALIKENPDVTDLPLLQKKSVALQGLGALDFILFGKEAETLESRNIFRCQFARTIGRNLDAIATKLATSWQQDETLRQRWVKPDETNPFFRTDKEAMNILIGTLIHGLEAVRDTRISVFLRENSKRDRPKSAPLWRSSATMRSIVANLQGLENLFEQSQIDSILPDTPPGTTPKTPPGTFNDLKESIRFEFTQALQTAKELDGGLNRPIAALLSDPAQRQKLAYLRLTIHFIVQRFDQEFAPAAGLAAGFSFGDGD